MDDSVKKLGSIFWAFRPQALTHRLDIFGHLGHFCSTVGFKKVVAPTLSRSHIRKYCWIAEDNVCSSYVFIKGHASPECTDTMESGCNEVMAKIAEEITHMVIRFLPPKPILKAST